MVPVLDELDERKLSWNAKHWLGMFRSLTDPDAIRANIRKALMKKRREQKRADTGIL